MLKNTQKGNVSHAIMATVAMMASTTRSRQNDVCSNSPTAADVRLSLLDRNQPGCLGRRKRTEIAQGGWRMCWKQMLTKPFQSNTRARVGGFREKRNGKKRKSDAENDMKDSIASRMRMDELYRIWLCEVDELSADSSDDESWSNDRRHPYYSRVYDSNMSSTDSSDSEDEVRSSVSEYVRKGPSRMKMDIKTVCKGTKCGFDEQSDTSCQTSGSSDYSWDEESKGVNKNSKKNFLRNKFFRKKGFHNKRNSNKIPKKMTSDVFAKTHETREDEECIEHLRGEGTTELAIICHGVVKTAQLKRITMRDNEIHANSSCVRKSKSPQSDEESRFKINVACESDLNLPWGQIKHEFVSNARCIKDTQNFSSSNDQVMDKFNFVTILGGNGYHKLCDGESSDKIAEEEIFNYGKRNEVRDVSTLKQIAHSEDVADDRKNNLNLKDLEHMAPAHVERNLKASRDNNGSFVDNKRVFYQACQHVVPDYPSSHQNPEASKETYSIEQCEYQRFGCKFSGSKMIVEEHMKSCVLEHLKLVSEVAKDQKDRLKNQEDEQHRQSILIQQLTDTVNDLSAWSRNMMKRTNRVKEQHDS
ncbi:uncharacterized protein LOC124441464 isoform X3 [Xenia sp. Carnegie-2017]|uniref:uncharacterized protein LOC124441464 isoform X3 n=1 Tax=Xenia sp. Carnegie-2017 TaxID=2897299 RepID=UPI001F03B0CD|nr:uncharacterized protein LOC124441464 isoform X3 [Xenia sp. Carnegie-2017]